MHTIDRPTETVNSHSRETDNLDRLLSLLEQARAEQIARGARLQADPHTPYRQLLSVLKSA